MVVVGLACLLFVARLTRCRTSDDCSYTLRSILLKTSLDYLRPKMSVP